MTNLVFNKRMSKLIMSLMIKVIKSYDKEFIVTGEDRERYINVMKNLFFLKEDIIKNNLKKEDIKKRVDTFFKNHKFYDEIINEIFKINKKEYLVKEIKKYTYNKRVVIDTLSLDKQDINTFLNKSESNYFLFPYELRRDNIMLINEISEVVNNFKNRNKYLIANNYLSIDDYLYFYSYCKKEKVNIGIKIKDLNDLYEVMEGYEDSERKSYFDCLILDLKSMYENREFSYFNEVILKDIRMIRDIIYKNRENLIIKMNGYNTGRCFDRLIKSGFKNLYIE